VTVIRREALTWPVTRGWEHTSTRFLYKEGKQIQRHKRVYGTSVGVDAGMGGAPPKQGPTQCHKGEVYQGKRETGPFRRGGVEIGWDRPANSTSQRTKCKKKRKSHNKTRKEERGTREKTPCVYKGRVGHQSREMTGTSRNRTLILGKFEQRRVRRPGVPVLNCDCIHSTRRLKIPAPFGKPPLRPSFQPVFSPSQSTGKGCGKLRCSRERHEGKKLPNRETAKTD